MTAKIELKNEQVWEDAIEGIFRRWEDDTYEVTVQEFDGFAYIVRLDVTEGHRGQGIGTAVVKAVRRRYGTVVASPEGGGGPVGSSVDSAHRRTTAAS